MIREIDASAITDAVASLCIDANYRITPDVKCALEHARDAESGTARGVLEQLVENARIAGEGELPMCQDTGMTIVFAEIGQDVHVTGGSFRDAVEEGVRRGYRDGYLRKSVVRDPIDRTNTNDNTPCILYTDIVAGDKIKITVAPKGFGSENMSAIAMLKPSQGIEGVKDFVVDTVRRAGSNPCPPIVVGVGVGGTFDHAAVMSKRALLRPVGLHSGDAFWADVERELLASINDLGIGPAGLGGATTALAVSIEVCATHIAGLPVAVNISCHATRHAEAIL